MTDFICSVLGIGLLNFTSAQLTEWVGIICTLVITLVTCGIQVYRMIRDRDKDKDKETKQKEIKK